MNSFFVFFQKELIELHRTGKIYIMGGIFCVFGMMGPLMSRYMAEILQMAMGTAAPVFQTAPTWSDSWTQYYSNLTQTGSLALILVFMNSVFGEKQSGTAELILSKKLSFSSFILAKYISSIICMFVVILLSSGLCLGYTYYLYGYAGELRKIWSSIILFYFFIMILLAMTTLASTLANTTVTAAILSLGGYLVLILSSYVPVIGKVMPGSLLTKTTDIITNANANINNVIQSIAIGVIIGSFTIFAAIQVIQKKEL